MNPSDELAQAAETLESHQVTMVPGLDQVLAMVLRGAADTIVNNVTRRLPDGLPIVPVSPDLLDLARLINTSQPAEPAPVVNRENVEQVVAEYIDDLDSVPAMGTPAEHLDRRAQHVADGLLAAGVFSETQPVDRDALIHAMARADRRPVKPESAEWRQVAEETYGRLADAVLALINGSES